MFFFDCDEFHPNDFYYSSDDRNFEIARSTEIYFFDDFAFKMAAIRNSRRNHSGHSCQTRCLWLRFYKISKHPDNLFLKQNYN